MNGSSVVSLLSRWRLIAGLVVLCPGVLNQVVTAGTGSLAAPARVSADEHFRHCRCGTSCDRGSCCCLPRGDRTFPGGRRHGAVDIGLSTCPRFGPVPCGRPVHQESSPRSGPLGRLLGQEQMSKPGEPGKGEFLPAEPPTILPERWLPLPEKPPERSIAG